MFSGNKTPVWLTISCCVLMLLNGCGPSADSIRATTQAELYGTATVVAAAQSTSAAQQAQDARATAAAEVQATVMAQTQATATAGAQATANAAAQATAVAQAQATAVAQVQATATAQARTTVTSQAQAGATAQARPTPMPTAPPVSLPATVNDVWNLQVKDISPNELQVTVDYGYTGDHGEEAYIGVEATGEIPGQYTPWGFSKIKRGRGTVTIKVLCYHPGAYLCKSGKTDALWIKFLTGTAWELNFFQKMFKYNKQWAPE